MTVESVSPPPPSEIEPVVSSATDGSGTDGGASMSATVSSLEELRQVAPPLYDAIMQSIAQRVRDDQNASNERLKQILREAAQDMK
jgi:hypothetical protein